MKSKNEVVEIVQERNLFLMANFIISCVSKQLLSIRATLPGQPGRRKVWVSGWNFLQEAAINTNRHFASASSFRQPVVAPIFVPCRSVSNSFSRLNMVNSAEVASATDSNGCDNGHSCGQKVLDNSASFKEVKIPLAWGHLAGMQSLLLLFIYPFFNMV